MAITSNQLYALLEEPDAEVNNYRYICRQIIDYLKGYLINYYEYQQIPSDQKLVIGSILIEYLFPLILDDYLMEEMKSFLFKQTQKKSQFKNMKI